MGAAVETTGRIVRNPEGTGGVLEIRHRAQFADAITHMRDGEVSIVIARKHAVRTLQANNYYWGVVVECLVDYTGHTADEMHEYLKDRFLPPETMKELVILKPNGSTVACSFYATRTTTHLNKVQFYDYCKAIKVWALLDLELDIPDPEDADARIAADYAARFTGKTAPGEFPVESEPRQLTEGTM